MSEPPIPRNSLVLGQTLLSDSRCSAVCSALLEEGETTWRRFQRTRLNASRVPEQSRLSRTRFESRGVTREIGE